MTDRFSVDTWYNRKKVGPEVIQGLANMMQEINNKITEAEQYAKQHGLVFSCDFGYGGGATYGLHSKSGADWQGVEYNESDFETDEYGDTGLYYWQTSTQNCM